MLFARTLFSAETHKRNKQKKITLNNSFGVEIEYDFCSGNENNNGNGSHKTKNKTKIYIVINLDHNF